MTTRNTARRLDLEQRIVGTQSARFILEHDRDAISNRESQAITAADQSCSLRS